MAALPWKNEYIINVAVIDDQHQRLAELVSRSQKTFESNGCGNELRIELQELLVFLRLHFATEEELMLKYDYPDYLAHRFEHKMVLRQLQSLLDRVVDRAGVPFEGEVCLSDDWVTQHLLRSDVPLGRFLNSRGIV